MSVESKGSIKSVDDTDANEGKEERSLAPCRFKHKDS